MTTKTTDEVETPVEARTPPGPGTVTAADLEQLAAITPEEEIKQRPIFNKAKEKVGELSYVDARFVMDRLDTAVGPANWQDKFEPVPGGVKASIGILISETWVWKADVGVESTIEATKGAYSDAFKRAAVKWGIGRDLYDAREEEQQRPAGQRTQNATQTTQNTQSRPQNSRSTGGGNGNGAAQGSRPRPIPVDPDDAPWVCPEHGGVVAFPAGVSAAGKDYTAFYACPEGRDCPHRAPRGLKVEARHLVAPSDDSDDLPF